MRFRLVQYFTATSLAAFVLVAAVLLFFERQQSLFFQDVQEQQARLLQKTQEAFARHQDEVSRRDLLAINESAIRNLSRLFANVLWERDFAPFLAKAQSIGVDHCRAIADVKQDGKNVAPLPKKACFSEVGQKIMAIAGFKELDARVFDTMKKSSVFKIKVYDLRGVTIYSSDPKQIGEDKSSNAGWKSAAIDGKPASQLSHRDQFGAFEGVVHDRDLMESYVPVKDPNSDKIVGVLEVYSDVTQFLNQIKTTSAALKKTADANQADLARQAAENQDRVESSSALQIGLVVGMLVLLYGALLAIVKRAQKIIEQQEKDRETAQQQLAQAEKMASLGQMVAGVAHQLNTPLAFSKNNVMMARDALDDLAAPLQAARRLADIIERAERDQIQLNIAGARARVEMLRQGDVDLDTLKQMLGDVLDGIAQMSELVVNLRNFTRLDRSTTTEADISKSVHTVVYIAKSVISNTIEVVEDYAELPAIECNVSQLNQVFLNLINNAAQAIDGAGTITVRTSVDGGRARIDVQDTGSGIAPDVLPHIFDLYYTTKPAGEGTGLGLHIARDIVERHGGEIKVATGVGVGTTVSVYLPIALPEPLAAAA